MRQDQVPYEAKVNLVGSNYGSQPSNQVAHGTNGNTGGQLLKNFMSLRLLEFYEGVDI